MEENVPEQAAEPMPAPEKTKKKSPVLTIILIFVALAGIGFGVYGMCFNKPAEKECIESEAAEKDEPGEKIEDKEDYAIYYDLVKKYFASNSYIDGSYYSSQDKSGAIYEDGDFSDINYMAMVLYDNGIIEVNSNPGNASGAIYNIDGFKNGLKDFFNYEGEVEEFTINCVGTFKLIPQNGGVSARYETDHFGGCGGAAGSVPTLTITNAKNKDDLLLIEVAYSRISSDPGGEYNIFNKDFETIADANQYFEDNLDKATKYKLTFKKADKHYYLESGEKLN